MTTKLTQFQEELILYFKARFTLIYIVSPEEERVLKEIADACEHAGKPAYSWDIADGFIALTEATGRVDKPTKDPLSALEMIQKIDQDAVFVLKDFHDMWGDKNKNNPQVTRKIKNVAQALRQTKKNIIVTSHQAKIPDELIDQTYIVDYPPPDFEGIKHILQMLEKE